MKIKVCGMKHPENIKALAALPIHYMGLIFYAPSPRYVANLDAASLALLPAHIQRVGVFVNEDIETVCQTIEKYKLTGVQLHGTESAAYCNQLIQRSLGVQLIKAFSVACVADLEATQIYGDVCDFFLFDTKTPQHGGSGKKFDWTILDAYAGETPFLLSGGISVNDAEAINSIQHSQFYGIDLNSQFEASAGLKDIQLLETFLNQLRHE